MSEKKGKVLCIGGGPAGLTAAYLLAQRGRPVVVLEANRRHLGGISRTVEHNGFRCDIGGHRFFSKSAEVNRLWEEILGDDLIQRERKSRIFYRGKFFDYPLKAGNALRGLGLPEAALCFLSFAWAQMRPAAEAASFVAKTLIDSFRYPRQGPGMMWEAAGDRIRGWGAEIRMGRRVVALAQSGDGWEAVSRRCMTTATPRGWRRCAASLPSSAPTCTWWDATACTSTTTRITP